MSGWLSFALTVGCCVVVGGLGLLVLRLLRHASLRWQLAVAVVTPAVAIAASVAFGIRMMFLSDHTPGVLMIAVLTSLALALGAAAAVLRQITRGSAALHAGIGRLVADSEGDATAGSEDAPLVPELDRVQRELADARRALAESRERQRNAERARHELVGFISRDLRAPLAGLRALSEALEDGVIADPPAAYARLRATIGQLTAQVDDLYELSAGHDAARTTA